MSVVAKQAVVSGDEAVMAAVPVFQSTDTLADRQERAPNHDAVPAAVALRKIIAATPAGARQLMSASLMVELLVAKEGLPEPMASRLFSQVTLAPRRSSPFLRPRHRALPPCSNLRRAPDDLSHAHTTLRISAYVPVYQIRKGAPLYDEWKVKPMPSLLP